jgi:hypothetical protein
MKTIRIFLASFILLTVTTFAQNPIDTNPIVIEVRDAANADNVSNQDLGKRYSMYRGMYLYGTHFDFEGCNTFGDVEAKLVKCRDKILPEKTSTLGAKINSIMKKYAELELNEDNKNKYLEDLNFVCEGLKAGVD